MKQTNKILLIIFFLSLFIPVYSQEIKGEDLEVRLFIVGQGGPVYSSWGHTGLAIKNKQNNKDVFFDFGNFYFENENFFKNFALGRMLYMAYANYTQRYIQSIVQNNRDLTEYVLNISNDKKLQMYEALILKSMPENRTYLYHNYNDNCSTRIRDYIDNAVNGQLKTATEIYRGSTFRKSFLLYTSHTDAVGLALSLLQGPPIDKEITIWQEMFLPAVMGEIVQNFTYKNDKGQTVPLILSKDQLNIAKNRKPVPDKYSPPFIRVILLSLILSAIILFLNIRIEKGKIKLFASMNIFAGFILGLTGSVLLFLAAFTDHTYSYNNLNLFMINPIAFFIIPASIMYLIKGEKWKKRIDVLWMIQIVMTLIMILIKILTPLKQDNLLEIILFLPILISFSPLIPGLLKKRKLLR
ncbi:MAG: DUF4105 domain-containing protein [Spirochaetaceae bacterium]|nr:DUF4105 domain-containing protein [Spirochaetaceae bacterium]